MEKLFLIGNGEENINIIEKLMDFEKIKEKPNYNMADG